MKTAAILALMAGTASAFTSSKMNSVSHTALKADAAGEDAVDPLADMVGAIDLRGKEFRFDPVRKGAS